MSVSEAVKVEKPREAGAQVVDAVVIGAGVAGIYQLYRLLKDGLTVQAFESGDGVGGVWYWNRYPGARVDSHFPYYQYWFSKELWDESEWKEHFPPQPEIEKYLNHVVDKFDLRRHIAFGARVTSATFDDESGTWMVRTDKGHEVRARFIVFNTGGLSEPKAPEFKGHETFGGQSYHTARWPKDAVDLTGKRVGVFGTAATGIQVIQTIAPIVSRLTVFQRTPNFAIALKNPKVTEQELENMRQSFDELQSKMKTAAGSFSWPEIGFDTVAPPLFKDVPADKLDEYLDSIWNQGNLRFWHGHFSDATRNPEAAEYIAEFVRKKIRSRVNDPKVAEKLAPTSYPFGVRRVPLENGFYEAFNRENVELVDLLAEPVVSIDKTGVNTSARHYDLDVIIYATGFDAGVGAINQVDIRGVGGRSLKEEWDRTLRTTVGMMKHGYPNLFMTMAPFAPASAFCNIPVCVDQQVDWIADTIGFARAKGLRWIQPSEATEAAWMAHHEEVSEPTLVGRTANSWYRRVAPDGTKRELIAYMGGLQTYRQWCNGWTESGYEGFDKS